MTLSFKHVLLAFFVGGLVGIFILSRTTDAKVDRVKRYADSVTVAATARADSALARAGILRARADSVTAAARLLEVEAAEARAARLASAAAARRALVAAKNARDSVAAIPALEATVANLEAEAGALGAANAQLRAALFMERARGDSLEGALRSARHDLVAINARVQALNRHRFPTWLRVGFGALKTGLAVKGAVDLARGR